MKKVIYLSCLGLLLLSGFTACTTHLDLEKMDKTIQLGSSLTLPLGQATVSVSDLFSGEFGSIFQTDSINNYVYVYWSDTLNFSVDNELADFTKGTEVQSSFADDSPANFFPETGSLPINASFAAVINQNLQESGDYIIDYDCDFNRYENGELTRRIDSLHINSLTLHLDVNLKDFTGISPTDCQIRMDMAFGSISGLTEKSIILQGNAFSETIHFSNFTLPFTEDKTKLPISIKFTFLVPDGKSFTVQSTSDILTSVFIDNIEVDKAWGYFNHPGNLVEDSFDIDIPDEIFQAEEIQNNRLLFHDPTVILDIESNIGIPLQVVIDRLAASDDSGNEVTADFKGSSSYTIDMEKPREGDWQTTRSVFNRSNGSTHLLFSIIPKTLTCRFHMGVNHEAIKNDPNHFLSLPLLFKIPIECKLPFQFDPGTSYTYTDTIQDTDISKIIEDMAGSSGDIDITDLNMTIDIENSLPVKAMANAIFLDENGQIVHTEENIEIPAPDVDSQGRSIETAEQHIRISADNNIKKTKQIVLSIRISGDKATDMIYFRFDDQIKATVGLHLKGLYLTDLDSL